MAARASKAFLALFLLAAPAAAKDRQPYLVDASSVAATVCWREAKKDECLSLSGLAPGAEFDYTVSSRAYTAKTLPASGAKLRFAVFGDSGMATAGQKAVAKLLETLDPDMVVFTGDVVYPTGLDKDYDAKFFKIYGRTLSRRPFFPCVGNHDYGNVRKSAAIGERRYKDGYERLLRRPKYYAFDAGPAHFVSLDTNAAAPIAAAEPIGIDSAQRRWLEKDLAASKARWTIVFMHVPLFSTYYNHGDNAGLRASLQSLFEKYRVDAVFAGHDHLYQRSKRMNKVVYLTVGTGGGTVMAGPVEEHPWLEKEVVSYGLALVTLEAKRLELSFLDDRGAARDGYLIDKP
ncbi:MAG: metallophosphoesterase [Elusimicrobia bacterium]|nr:metallophosphoesterase [Elusimicrobiota bacterium]